MKKILFGFALIIAITTSSTSCQKEATDNNQQTANNNLNPCVGSVSAFLLPDSLTTRFCQPNFSYFYVPSTQKTLKLNNTLVAIDTIVNGANFAIVYDSISPLPCAGQIMNNIQLQCYTRLP